MAGIDQPSDFVCTGRVMVGHVSGWLFVATRQSAFA